MKIFTLRELLKAPSDILAVAKNEPVVITSRTHGNFKLIQADVEIEITKKAVEVR